MIETRSARHQQDTREARRKLRNAQVRKRIVWYVLGVMVAMALMEYFDLWSPMAVLAVLGVADVVGRVWSRLGSWLGA